MDPALALVLLLKTCSVLHRASVRGDFAKTTELLDHLLKEHNCNALEGASSAAPGLDCFLSKLYPRGVGFTTNVEGKEFVYGEVTPTGVRELIAAVPTGISADDQFVDLGSGVGRVPLQIFFATAVRRSTGIELENSRHGHATAALKAVHNLATAKGSNSKEDVHLDLLEGDSQSLTVAGRTLAFVHGDALTAALEGTSIIFINSLAFPDDLWMKLQTHLVTSLAPGTILVIGHKLKGCSRGLMLLQRAKMTMTWSDSYSVFVYMMTTPKAAAASFIEQGSDMLVEGVWGTGAAHIRHLKHEVETQLREIAVHTDQGDKVSAVACDAFELEALLFQDKDKAHAWLKTLDLAAPDDEGRRLLQFVCDKHTSSVRAVRAFGGPSYPGTGSEARKASFQAFQRERQVHLKSLVRLVLDEGAETDARDMRGRTALSEAVTSEDHELAALLRAYGARVEVAFTMQKPEL